MVKESEFLEACREGNVIKVEHLLASKNKKYIVPLFSKTASALLHCKDERGSTPLHQASLYGRKAVVYLLLDEGADVRAADADGCLPLHLAAWNGHLDVAAALISHDAHQETINALTKDQETALHFAAQYGHSGVVSLLLKNGAHSSVRNSKGETPLDLAAKYGRTDVARRLLEANPHMVLNTLVRDPKEADAQVPPPTSPLHLAAKNGKTEVVRLLLDSGFDINCLTEDGTALHIASLFGKVEVVQLLLERGVNADARDFCGRTVMELLEEHQTEKPVVLSHLMPNQDAWQHCSSLIGEYLERTSEVSSVSKEVATIYLNSLRQKQQQQHVQPDLDDTPSQTPQAEDTVWLPIPSNSLERMNFEQGIKRSPSSKIGSGKGTPASGKPLSILTDFNVPPPTPSAECGSICSTISFTATATPSPPSTIASASSLSPRFPVGTNFSVASLEKKPKPARIAVPSACTYQSLPLQYDNVPRPSTFPRVGYDNVPTNAVGYDNAPPPSVHAWDHECCNPAKPTDQKVDARLNDVHIRKEIPSISQNNVSANVEITAVPIRVSDLCATIRQGRQNSPRAISAGTALSVKFAEAPPETLYLPVEAKLYTRMEKPFSPTLVPVDSAHRLNPAPAKLRKDQTSGPYDDVPTAIADKGKIKHQEKSPDAASLPAEQEIDSMELIERTIQVIEQSSKDMEDNIDALVRCPSRSSQRSENTVCGSRPATPSSSTRKFKKIPPPVSPKPKLPLVAVAPLAQQERDLSNSKESMTGFVFNAAAASAVGLEARTVPRRSLHRSSSRRRSCSASEFTSESPSKAPLGGSFISCGPASAMKRPCVDHEAQVDSGTASDCGGSVCSCSEGSQCSLINPKTPGSATRRSFSKQGGDDTRPVDEPAEWNQIEEIFKSCGTGIARLSVFDDEMQTSLANYLKNDANTSTTSSAEEGSSSHHKLCNSAIVEQWLASFGMEKCKDLFIANGFDRLEFLGATLDETALRYLGIVDQVQTERILVESNNLPAAKIGSARSFRYVSDWLQAHGCQDYLGEFIKRGYDTMWKVLHLEAADLDVAFEKVMPLGHRLRLMYALSAGEKDESNVTELSECLRSHAVAEGTANNELECLGTFSAHYLGSTLVEDVTGIDATRMSMTKLKKATKEITKIPQVMIEIGWQNIRLYDAGTRRPLCEHAVPNVRGVSQDERDLNCFAYIVKDGTRHFCHVFSMLTADVAAELILTLGKAFDIAYRKAVGGL